MLNAKNSTETIRGYQQYLRQEEKSKATIEKYLRDIRCFFRFLGGRDITKESTLEYKHFLTKEYAPASVNSMIIALNGFLSFAGMAHCKIKPIKIQRQLFCREEKELSPAEYKRLLKAASGSRLEYVIRTICETGIRVSELQYITVESVHRGKAVVECKNKTRVIFIPVSMQNVLKAYIKKSGIQTGAVFVSKSGKPLNRSNIWRDMKTLCVKAGVSPNKVFPHNLRHLFARTFYSMEHDIVRLADLLGHSSINTTRMYTTETGNQHLIRLERVHNLLMT